MHTPLKFLHIYISNVSHYVSKRISSSYLSWKYSASYFSQQFITYIGKKRKKLLYLVSHLAHFNFARHMLCCVLQQIWNLLSRSAALEMVEGKRNPTLYYPPIQVFVLDQHICFHLPCPELASNKTILPIFSFITLSLHDDLIDRREF